MIYELLLVSPAPIDGAHFDQGGSSFSNLLSVKHKPVPGIDARLLYACRQIYKEATSVLYGNNFQFSSATDMSDFGSAGLTNSRCFLEGMLLSHIDLVHYRHKRPASKVLSCVFLFANNYEDSGDLFPCGRFFCVRSLTLNFLSSKGQDITWGQGWTLWNGIVLRSSGQPSGRSFPALQDLTLDFLAWNLPDDGSLKV